MEKALRSHISTKLIFVLLFVSSIAFADAPPLEIKDEGTSQGRPAYILDCVGAGISCTRSGITGTMTVSGDAVGPASSTDNAVARFDGTTGKLLQNSVAILSDAGAFTGLTGITMNGNLVLSANGNTITIGGSVLDGGASFGTLFDINANNGLPVTFFRGSGAGQPLHLYGVSSAANANYERLNWGLVSSVWTFASEAAGTGTVRNFNFSGGKVGIGTAAPSTLLHVGLAGTTLGTLGLAGNTSGLVTIQPAAAAGTWTLTLPTDDGDANQVLSTNGSGVSDWVDVSDSSARVSSVGITIDGGGSAITTGVKGYISIPYACTINTWVLLADQSGSIVIDVWKDTLANYPPTVADTIAGSEKPTLSTATNNTDTNLTTWTTSVTAGDVIGFNVDSATTVTRVHLIIKVTKT